MEKKNYLVFITTGGLMEDPQRKDEDVITVKALSIDHAVAKWARLTNHNDSNLKNDGETWTYWGWKITVHAVSDEIQLMKYHRKGSEFEYMDEVEWFSDQDKFKDTIFNNHGIILNEEHYKDFMEIKKKDPFYTYREAQAEYIGNVLEGLFDKDYRIGFIRTTIFPIRYPNTVEYQGEFSDKCVFGK